MSQKFLIETKTHQLSGTIKNAKEKSAWILCHGLLNDSQSFVCQELFKKLPCNTIVFDFRGNGESTGKTSYGNYDEEAEDLLHICQYFHQQDITIEGVLGHSKGANVVLAFAALFSTDFEKLFNQKLNLVSLAPRFHMLIQPKNRFSEQQWRQLEEVGQFDWKPFPNQKEKMYVITKEDYERRLKYPMRERIEELKKKEVQVLIIHGENDSVIPVEDTRDLQTFYENGNFVYLKGVDHFFKEDGAIDSVVEALKAYFLNK